MLAAFLIMLREGMEAAIIVGIVATYLNRTSRAVNLYSGEDGDEFAAGLDAIAGAAQVLALLTAAAAPEAAAQVEAEVAEARAAVEALATDPSGAGRGRVADRRAALAQALDALDPALGLDG